MILSVEQEYGFIKVGKHTSTLVWFLTQQWFSNSKAT